MLLCVTLSCQTTCKTKLFSHFSDSERVEQFEWNKKEEEEKRRIGEEMNSPDREWRRILRV